MLIRWGRGGHRPDHVADEFHVPRPSLIAWVALECNQLILTWPHGALRHKQSARRPRRRETSEVETVDQCDPVAPTTHVEVRVERIGWHGKLAAVKAWSTDNCVYCGSPR